MKISKSLYHQLNQGITSPNINLIELEKTFKKYNKLSKPLSYFNLLVGEL